MSTALTSFVSGDENQQQSLAIGPSKVSPNPEQELVAALPSSQQQYLSRQEDNYLVANGVDPGAVLPSGRFKTVPLHLI
jgi:hypothetical protein